MKLRSIDGGKAAKQPQRLIDADAEREVLACVLVAPTCGEALTVLDSVPDEDWALVRHVDIAAAMRAVVDAGYVPDVVLVAQQMQRDGTWERHGGARCLSEVLDRAGTLLSARGYAKRVRELARARRLVEIGQRLQVDASTRSDEVAAVLAELRTTLDAVGLDDEGEATVSHAEAVRAYVDELAQPCTDTRLRTSIRRLDTHCDGGLARGWLVVVQAAAKVGKTALIGNGFVPAICGDLIAPGSAHLISLEMGRNEHLARWLARETGGSVPTGVQVRRDLHDSQWSAIHDAADRVARWRVTVDERSRSLAAIRASATAAAKVHGGLDLLVVDGLTQVANPGMEGNRTADIDVTTRGLKELAVELSCVVVLAVHVDKPSAKGGKPGLYDARGSSGPANDANLLLVPYTDEQDPSRAGLRVFGRSVAPADFELGTLKFDGSRMCFGEPS